MRTDCFFMLLLCGRGIHCTMNADFHNDILTVRPLPLGNELEGLDCGVLALYLGKRSIEELFAVARGFRKTGGYELAFEEISGITDEQLETLISFRPRYVTLTWNHENDLAHGCKSSGGLKPRGKEVIRRLNRAGIAEATAHLCRQRFFDVCDASDRFVNSHTCFSAVHANARNIDDEQIECLHEAGALVGVTFVGAFLTAGKADSENVVRHVDHYVQKYGAEGVCLGSDFYGTQDLPADLLNYKSWDILVEKFLKIGYNREVIEQILYLNLKNFLYGR